MRSSLCRWSDSCGCLSRAQASNQRLARSPAILVVAHSLHVAFPVVLVVADSGYGSDRSRLTVANDITHVVSYLLPHAHHACLRLATDTDRRTTVLFFVLYRHVG